MPPAGGAIFLRNHPVVETIEVSDKGNRPVSRETALSSRPPPATLTLPRPLTGGSASARLERTFDDSIQGCFQQEPLVLVPDFHPIVVRVASVLGTAIPEAEQAAALRREIIK